MILPYRGVNSLLLDCNNISVGTNFKSVNKRKKYEH